MVTNSARSPRPWKVDDMDECLICGATTDLTVEHIIPQTLWNRFGIDPNGAGDVAKTRTILCSTCNSATGQLHERGAMLDLIAEGVPVTKQTLRQLADWTFWVTILLGLARGVGVLPLSEARSWLRDRFFSSNRAGVPRGLRVYAGRSADPLPTTIPAFATSKASVPAAHELFVREPLLLGVDLSLLPVDTRRVVEAFTARPNDWPSSPTSR